MNLSLLRINSISRSRFPILGKSSRNLPEKSSQLVSVPVPISVKIYSVNSMAAFPLLLVVCGVTFSMFSITNGSVSTTFIETTTLPQSTEQHSWEDRDGEHFNYSDSGYETLLTLFITFKNRKDKWRSHWNVIQNWSLFQPKVRVVLFNDGADRRLLQFAHNLNWTVLPVPHISHHATTTLKQLFLTCQRHIPNSVFYGYANGDILFDRSLLKTIKVVSSNLKELEESLVVVGESTHFKVRGRRITTLEEVRKIANTKGKRFHADAKGYFFLAHSKFPWESMSDIDIERLGYSNYLIAIAQKYGITVIDATQTLVALHQTGYDRNYASQEYTPSQHNKPSTGSIDDRKGLTSTSQYVTQYDKDGCIKLCRRPSVQSPATFITLKMPSTEAPATLTNITKYKGNMYSINIKSFHDSPTPITPISKHGSQEHLVDLAARREVDIEGIGEQTIDEVLRDEPIPDNREYQLLTLFTVFTSDLAHNSTLHINTLQNWAWFHPHVTTVLFSDDSPVIDTMSKQLNWTVLPTIPQTGASLPLKEMFLQVQNLHPRSTFYGYIKDDLLFGDGLVQTLKEVAAVLGDDLESALLVGAKYPYILQAGQEILYKPSKVDGVMGLLSKSNSSENFMLAHYLFPWQHLPDLVIGHSVYNNYLVALALRYDFAVVDVTHTLTALEQISHDTACVQTKPEDFNPNLLAALDYAEGYVTSAQYETTYDASGKVKLLRRQSERGEPILLSQPQGP